MGHGRILRATGRTGHLKFQVAKIADAEYAHSLDMYIEQREEHGCRGS
jgi:hypothetical protein